MCQDTVCFVKLAGKRPVRTVVDRSAQSAAKEPIRLRIRTKPATARFCQAGLTATCRPSDTTSSLKPNALLYSYGQYIAATIER